MKESDSRYQKINKIQSEIAVAKNPHMHGLQMNEADQKELILELENAFREELKNMGGNTKPEKISREDYFREMLDCRDKCRESIIEGGDTGSAVILTIIQSNFQTIYDADANNLLVDFFKIGETFTYKIKTKKKMGFLGR